ncbi:tyrosine-type recombinase/integrase [Cohnella sp.]|uniref:tyrosine-type recombinase/integrase n=1 Tax=Cohnella sp. TaxID=1883426 RepID=UPI0035644C24
MKITQVYNSQSLVLPDNVSPRVQFREAVKLYLLDCRYRNLAPTTINFYKFHLQAFEHFMDHYKLELKKLVATDLSHRMIHYMIDQQLTANTMNGRIRTCQGFFKFLWQDGILETNLADGLEVMKARNQMLFTFTKDQVRTILEQPDQTTFTGYRDYAIMLVLLETGMRVMELTSMRLSDINFEDQAICIPMGKGRKPRIVPIQLTCMKVLLKYIQERGNLSFDEVWITLNNKPLRKAAIERIVRDHCKKTALQGVRGSCHTFRHTMAKMYLMNGGDILTLQYILGHTTLDMTRRYIEFFGKDLHLQHEKSSPIEFLLQPEEHDNEEEESY